MGRLRFYHVGARAPPSGADRRAGLHLRATGPTTWGTMAAMARPPLLLLPPSEGKASGGGGAPWSAGSQRFADLDDRRQEVATALADAVRGPGAPKLLGVKGTALEAAVAADVDVLSSPTMPAIRRYTGVLYDALDAGSLARRERDRLRRQVLIFSGLWGVVGAGDPVPDYKLKMGAALPGLGTLSTWWRPAVTEALAPVVGRRVVWDLLPGEHRAAWRPDAVGTGSGAPAAVLAVRFLDEDAPERGERRFRTVSHWNKLLKGALVRHVLTTGADEPDALAGFSHPQGYVYDPTLTEEGSGTTTVALVRPAG